MRLISPSYEIIGAFHPVQIMEQLERYARVCYKSENKIEPGSANKLLTAIMSRGHESVIEHEHLTVKFTTDRGVTHELVRHRLVSYSQESTRYCNYGHDHVTFILPPWVTVLQPGIYEGFPGILLAQCHTPQDESSMVWCGAMLQAESHYNSLLAKGWKPEQARSVLPNSLKTEIITTANLREWRHILKLRTSKAAHPQMRQLMLPLLSTLQTTLPVLFWDIPYHEM